MKYIYKYNYCFNCIFEEDGRWMGRSKKYFQNIKVLKIFNIVTFYKIFLKKKDDRRNKWEDSKYKSIRMK